MQEAYGVHLTPIIRSQTNYEGRLSTARSHLGEEAFAMAWAEGKAMSLGQAIEYALSREEEREPPTLVAVAQQQQQPPVEERMKRLTRREQEIALLVGRELTNRQIALELSISEHTVANHLRKILKKLNLRSRVQIGPG
jgi:DNA-binding NarL/FixJ family response regulator